MSNYQVLSKILHANYRWQRTSSYAFAADDQAVPLVQQELYKAAAHLPVAWLKHGNHFALVALVGLQAGCNLLVAPSNGQWVGGYVPAALRAYPFALLPAEGGRLVLAMDMDSGQVGEIAAGEALLAHGQPTENVQAILNFLTEVEQNRNATQRLCAMLAAHELIQPWPIKTVKDGKEQSITGLYRIDAAKLNQLDAQALHSLQQAGALQMAYLQLASMEHLTMLGTLARMHTQYQHSQLQALQPLPTNHNGELDLEFLNQGGTLSFSS